MHVPLLATLLALAATLPTSSPTGSPAEVRYPESAPGRHARAYFPAFAAGEEAMRAFWTAHGSARALAERPVEPRLEVWRRMQADLGTLTPVRVTDGGDDFVEVLAHAGRGRSLTIRFQCEAEPPHGLVALRVEDAEDTGGGDGARPPEAGPPPTEEEIVAALGAEADSLARAGAFSGAILVDKGGTTLFGRAWGEASRESHAPNRPDTRFNLGSINKIFTHVAILQLAQAGRLTLDDRLDRWLEDYRPEDAKRITIRMLLEHRAGVPDFFRNPALERNAKNLRTLADWYAVVRDMPLDFAPGTKQAYSNGGFVLLGMVIAKASGEDYYDYIRRHIYAPAGMTRSDHYALGEQVEGIASGYTRDAGAGGSAPGSGGLTTIPEGHVLGRGNPAGGGYSTVEDLARFARALRSGTLLDSARTRELIGDPPGLAIGGGSPGVNALLQVEGPYTLAVLSNLDPPAAERFSRTAGRALARLAGGGPRGARQQPRVGGGK